jgi:uncharacterized protein YbaR (Trm112 family)
LALKRVYGWWWVGENKTNLYKYLYIYIFMMKKNIVCPFCEGTKYIPAEDVVDSTEEGLETIVCPDCKGKGYVYP